MKFLLNNIDTAAKQFVEELGKHTIFAFHGPMGAGKTTFIQAVCRALGVTDVINSPTFAIVNEYIDAKQNTIYHFDFYRINRIEEALDFGCLEYFESGNLCLIEWPENIESLLPENTTHVYISENEDGSRKVIIEE